VRNIRGEMNIPPSKALDVLFKNGSDSDQQRLENNGAFLKTLAKIASITWLKAGDKAPMSATSLVGNMELLVPMAGLIDKDAEKARLSKEIDKLQKELQRIDSKLNNPKFVDKAPADVVAKEKEKQNSQQTALGKLREQLSTIEAL
jgi:valyl-tRNA synthetase